jgi:hypothetical protein
MKNTVFKIPEDAILHSHLRENLKSCLLISDYSSNMFCLKCAETETSRVGDMDMLRYGAFAETISSSALTLCLRVHRPCTVEADDDEGLGMKMEASCAQRSLEDIPLPEDKRCNGVAAPRINNLGER